MGSTNVTTKRKEFAMIIRPNPFDVWLAMPVAIIVLCMLCLWALT